MKLERKRIFINDLPETTTQNDLENAVGNYGNVASVEIKERKELGLKNTSLFFAFINVDIDDRSLQQCFKDFASGKWFPQRIGLQIARESFLDRLKKEREETGVSKKVGSDSFNVQQNKADVETPSKLKRGQKTEFAVSQNGSNASNDEHKKTPDFEHRDTLRIIEEHEHNEIDTNETIDLIVKNNKGKVIDKSGLKIESVGKSPILRIDKSKKKPSINTSEANLKRLQSLSNLKKTHKTQKLLVQQALSNIDSNSKKKIIFEDTENNIAEGSHLNNKLKKSLFDEEYQEDDFEPSFEIKEQFEGKKGQKLLELQARYKNDKRFILNARFLEDEDPKETENQSKSTEEISLEEEKKKEYEILEQVLGTKILPKFQHKKELGSQKKVMLRFDPSQPEHSKFELKIEAKKEKKKRKFQDAESEVLNEKKQEEKDVPNVSKEIFYRVTDDLKDSLKEKGEFSLLSMFGKVNEEQQQDTEQSSKSIPVTSTSIANDFVKEKNPFRYDSSDDEDETDISGKEKVQVEMPSETDTSRSKRNAFWFEPFFFTDDDYRLQEGADFVEKISTKEDGDFTKLRRNLKEIVKAKVRNNQRKNRPFKKKLGGSKKKKMLRMKRALKR